MLSLLRHAGLYWRSVRHLRAQQLYARVRSRLPHAAPDLRPAPLQRPPLAAGAWVTPPARPPRLVDADTLRLFGESARIARASDWSDESRPLLTRFHLHYFEDLCARGAGERQGWHRALLSRWLRENPPGSAPGWHPFPTSVRLVHLAKWLLGGARSWPALLHSMAVQARHLATRLEFSLLGNHLLENGRALLFCGAIFSGAEAAAWFGRGRALYASQLSAQLLADGAHFERSPMYHALVLEGLLDAINLHRAFGWELPAAWAAQAGSMLAWLASMTHPDGEIALFNDAAFGVALAPAELSDYARRLGIAPEPAWQPGPTGDARASGYVRLERGRAALFADLGELGPDYLTAHGHADTLSFELSVDGRRLVVDSGTSHYGPGPERLRQRSTAAHNTVVIDGESSSEMWGGFRVGRRARVGGVAVAPGDGTAQAYHDGYAHLPGRPLHQRRFALGERELAIEDEVRGSGEHRIDLAFHFHPDVELEAAGDGSVRFSRRGDRLRGTLRCQGGLRLEPRPASYHPEFGCSLPAWQATGTVRASLPLRLVTLLGWE